MEHGSDVNRFIVITSIFKATEAVEKFAAMGNYRVVVVGDKKTPDDWRCQNVEYQSVENQLETGGQLQKVLPFNHYCRKMMGYLYAMGRGAEYIIDTDDDNIPKAHWGFPSFEGDYDFIPGGKNFINVYELYSNAQIWPRGLPLHLITTKFDLEKDLSTRFTKIGIWQGLADEDPDVDAIYRLTNNAPCYFNDRRPVVLGKGTISPFNTQNTMIRKELFALMYLPTYVTFRFTDILRGLVAQPIMWLFDYHLGFVDATVVQKRNPHDYMQDFISEIPMYKHCEDIMNSTYSAISKAKSIEDNLYDSYEALLRKDIVEGKELKVLSAWLEDMNQITLENKRQAW